MGWGGKCFTPVFVKWLKLRTLTRKWIGVHTGSHGFKPRTPHKSWCIEIKYDDKTILYKNAFTKQNPLSVVPETEPL